MQIEYYYITDGESKGPYGKDALKYLGIEGDTLVWRAGLPDWVKAGTLEELADVFAEDSAFGTYAEMPDDPYYAMMNGVRVGPMSISVLIEKGLNPETPVWKNGMNDWAPAATRSDIMDAIRRHQQVSPTRGNDVPPYNPFSTGRHPCPANNYGMSGKSVGPYNSKSAGFQPVKHSDWLIWAIIGTIVGFLFSCIGVVFGIIGIVQANKANNFYAQGNDIGGDMANSSAKTMTIISLILGGAGFVAISLWSATSMFGACTFLL